MKIPINKIPNSNKWDLDFFCDYNSPNSIKMYYIWRGINY